MRRRKDEAVAADGCAEAVVLTPRTILTSALALVALLPLASAGGGPDLPPIVDACTSATGWCEGLACVTVSRQVPVCVDRPSLACVKDPSLCIVPVCETLHCPYATLGAETVSAPGPCMERYWERQVTEDVKIVSRSSCEYDVYYKDRPLLQ